MVKEDSKLVVTFSPSSTDVKLGDFVKLGKYTVLVGFLCEMMILCQLGNQLFMMFSGATPKLIACGNYDLSHFDDKEACHQLSLIKANNASEDCLPQLDTQFDTVNMEWNYYCEGGKSVKHSTSVQMIGVMIGSIVFGQFSDSFGRKKAMIIALLGCIISMMATSFTNNLFTFTFARLIVNIFNGGSIAVMLVYCVENLPKKDRLWINNVVSWAPNYILYAIVAYFSADWRTLARVSSLLTIPPLLLLIFMSESAQFLAQKGKLDEAQAVIERMYKINGHKCDTVLLKQTLNREKESFEAKQSAGKTYTFFHLFYTWKFATFTIVLAFGYFVTSIVNYGIVYNMEKVSGSIYINAILIGVIRYALNLVMAFLDYKFTRIGRKLIHMGAWIEIVLACFATFLVHATQTEKQFSGLIRICSVSIVAVSAQLYITNGIVSGELFPTCIRNLSYSHCQFWTRVGVVISPQLFLLNELWGPLPYIAMGCLGLLDAIIFQTAIPETKGCQLLESMPTEDECIVGCRRRKNAAQKAELEKLNSV
uniref:Major facilitator superfamily (MFS) profile domain-containing protein n=1 Tax=Panagrolaimus superbus TaxID=310955 RepID=A0A914YNE7_9BILA